MMFLTRPSSIYSGSVCTIIHVCNVNAIGKPGNEASTHVYAQSAQLIKDLHVYTCIVISIIDRLKGC